MDALEKALLDFSMTRAEKPTKQQRNAAQEAAHRPYEAMSEVTRAATPYVSLGQKKGLSLRRRLQVQLNRLRS